MAYWNDARIREHLQRVVMEGNAGVMLSDGDLLEMGEGSLARAIARSDHSYREWADMIGAEIKDTNVSRSYDIETWVKGELEARGHKVEYTTHKCPYDLLVDGKIRVEVKSSPWKASKKAGTYGYAFRMGRNPQHRAFDVGVFVGVDEDNNPERVYIMPAARARQTTVTITASASWNKYLSAWRYCKGGQ